MTKRMRIGAAVVCWSVPLLSFVAAPHAGPDDKSGAVLIVVTTLPWSFIVLASLSVMESIPVLRPVVGALATGFGNFLVFPLLCGGINALILYSVLGIDLSGRPCALDIGRENPADANDIAKRGRC
jgi:hypothetical protein